MRYKYSKFRPEDLDGIDLEDLLSRLSDMLLGSGFDDPYGIPGDDEGLSMQALHDAILEALLSGALSDEMLERLLGKDWQSADDAEERIDQLVQQIGQLRHQLVHVEVVGKRRHVLLVLVFQGAMAGMKPAPSNW